MTPSTPTPTAAGALADAVLHYQRVLVSTGYKEGYFRCGHCYERGQGDDHTITHKPECPVLVAISVKARNSAPQETRGDEPVADPMRDLALMWGCRANALRILNSHREEPDAASDQAIETYEECADELRKALAASQQSPRLEREALEAAERELTDLARPICCVYNRTAKKYEFTDAHIAQALPGTFEVIRQIRAALLSPDTSVVPSPEREPGPMVPWELDCRRAVCAAPECECPAVSSTSRCEVGK